MSNWKLIRRNLRYDWRTHLGVVLGAAVSTAVLIRALLVGDSVEYSLEKMALARLGDTQVALIGQNRFFRAALADELVNELTTKSASEITNNEKVIAAAVLGLRGLVINPDSGIISCNLLTISFSEILST